jgi:hypothetical protein
VTIVFQGEHMTTADQRLWRAWQRRAQDQEAVTAILDQELRAETLEPLLGQMQPKMDPMDFDALQGQAYHRAELFQTGEGENVRQHALIGCPIMCDERAWRGMDAAFWNRLALFASSLWQAQSPSSVHIRPLGQPLRIEAVTTLNIRGWHRLLRDAATQAPVSPALDRIEEIHRKLGEHTALGLAKSAAVVISQRLQLAVVTYDPAAFATSPSLAALYKEGSKHTENWKRVTGPLPDFAQVVPPQRLRGALAVTLSQYLEAQVTVGLLHRGLPSHGELEWVEGDTSDSTLQLLPRHNGVWLDPIALSGHWLNAVGLALTNQVLIQVAAVFANAKPAVQPPEPELPMPRRRVLQ